MSSLDEKYIPYIITTPYDKEREQLISELNLMFSLNNTQRLAELELELAIIDMYILTYQELYVQKLKSNQ